MGRGAARKTAPGRPPCGQVPMISAPCPRTGRSACQARTFRVLVSLSPEQRKRRKCPVPPHARPNIARAMRKRKRDFQNSNLGVFRAPEPQAPRPLAGGPAGWRRRPRPHAMGRAREAGPVPSLRRCAPVGTQMGPVTVTVIAIATAMRKRRRGGLFFFFLCSFFFFFSSAPAYLPRRFAFRLLFCRAALAQVLAQSRTGSALGRDPRQRVQAVGSPLCSPRMPRAWHRAARLAWVPAGTQLGPSWVPCAADAGSGEGGSAGRAATLSPSRAHHLHSSGPAAPLPPRPRGSRLPR